MVPDSIVIDGIRQGERYKVIIDGAPILLQPVAFRLIAVLGIQHFLRENDGWVQASELYRPTEIVSRYIYRLKQSIYSVSPRLQSWKVVENDRQGKYRLIAEPGGIFIEPAGIRQFGDCDLERRVDKLVAIENEQPSYM